MAGEYHGWDEEEGGWRFAEVTGHQHNDHVFVIEDFGSGTTPRQALSAIMSAMNQFQGRVQVVCNDTNTKLLNKLKEASLLKTAPLTVNGEEQWGILGVRSKQPAKKAPWWKFW